ncbi:arabinogalactan endo-1,4-beta-galactosidase [Xanthomonas hyacinthi]|uniref:Arabinogalactan endo-beta-1,4-galactanase n=1 Tax=Xanthomonas hyacinthi TaxID=56455 RepID=A0A2S7ESU8_9XANT|nr:glycosyl hydrolase 53 family protein [Xanthomonas hyacinthi]KLD77750.1 arabinogalactan endo-1,4-beta-galactosidase [Xanthomonas hyacinthi DSM 19077]PPU96179.1 arabinogalactan endo-1,4-beta-galactosidase [Xanthomonas hyacinthi]QGY77365.1 arabinogalactan endo-1,4-beta-galactosidase [Xanthomonas hyacinthi]
MNGSSKRICAWLTLLLPTCLCAPAAAQNFAKGADVSWIDQQENSGRVFRNAAGANADFFALLKGTGVDAIRLPVWVNPKDGWCGGADVLSMAKRAKAQGMRIMLDVHYSDGWADPGRQTKPAAWNGDTFSKLVSDVYAHTSGILSYLKSNGIGVSWVQVGNEINGGMLWPDGKTPNFGNLAQLIDSGYNASKAVYPDAKVVVHLANGYDNATFRWFFDRLKSAGGKWDAVGMSYYPSSSGWQSANTQIASNMRDMVARYGTDVIVGEVGMDWQQDAATRSMLADLVAKTRAVGAHGLGVFYWEPDAYPGWQGYTRGAVNSNGQLTQALSAFQ